MFVGWHRNNFSKVVDDFSKDILCDKNLLLNSWNSDKTLSFGAYEQSKLHGAISAYPFEKSIFINNFYYKETLNQNDKERLLALLLKNIDDGNKTIMVLVSLFELTLFERFGFKEYGVFYKVLYSSGLMEFKGKFDDATPQNHMNILRVIDKDAFEENRYHYIDEVMQKSSSLFLTTPNGYQHSYALSKNIIKISPWIMRDGAYDDSMRLLRTILHHRGGKNILAFIPDVKEIRDLYISHNFDFMSEYRLMYLNTKPSIDLEMVYGF
jgi:hypothetical protein